MFTLFPFNDTSTTEISTLSLHDALPIFSATEVLRGNLPDGPHRPDRGRAEDRRQRLQVQVRFGHAAARQPVERSEEHTSELQSRRDLVCRLLLEKKNTKNYATTTTKLKY